MTAPITFSEDARRAMMLYRWPGNVRQLKNIVEQLALFNAGEEISRDVLLEALPLSSGGDADRNVPYSDLHSYEQEREFLWQTLFALKSEISDLRETLTRAGISPHNAKSAETQMLLPKLPQRISSAEALLHPEEEEVNENSGMTLEDAEKEAVAEALRRNKGDKKLAAEQLNISQRTLYRKIREYGLEN